MFVKSLFRSYQLHAVLGWGRHLHPVVLPLLYRYPIFGCLDKLILEVLEAVQTDGGHVTILHGDRAFSLLVLTEERKIHDTKSSDPLSVGSDMTDEADVVVDVILA